MPAHFSTTDLPPGALAWQELEDVFAVVGQAVRSPASPAEFYRELLDQVVRALSAVGGAVWLRSATGSFQLVAHNNWPLASAGADIRQAHETLLARAAAHGRFDSVAARSAGLDLTEDNTAASILLIAPVQLPAHADNPQPIRHSAGLATGNPQLDLARHKQSEIPSDTLAIIEVLGRADAGPGAHRGHEQFLTAICELAADYHTFRELGRLRRDDNYREQLLRLGQSVHRDLGLAETAYTVANDGRAVIGCDRLSVLMLTGGHCRLLAASGAQRVERRSAAARHLEVLGLLVGRTADGAHYDDGETDSLPQIADALGRHAEASQARQIAAVPLRASIEPADGEGGLASKAQLSNSPTFVLIAEQFDVQPGELQRSRLQEVADVCSTALTNARLIDQMPLAWLLRPIGVWKQRALARWPRYALALAAIVAAVAALIFIPADFNIEATGTLQPVVQRAAFAPRSGLVEEVLVKHGANVKAGQPLLRLRDPALELELKRVGGELETTQRQIDAVRATKTGRAVRDANPTETYRLSAEERELDQRLANLRRELALLEQDRQQLVVTSPIAGRVLTWDLAGQLMSRPVERGEVLVTVADLSAEWQLELDVPDDRIGHVLAAQEQLGAKLPVRFRLSSDDRQSAAAAGHVTEICRTADVANRPGATPSPTVRVNVALDAPDLAQVSRDELRPGVSARAQIACGQRRLGYVWLHDIWDAAIGWLRF